MGRQNGTELRLMVGKQHFYQYICSEFQYWQISNHELEFYCNYECCDNANPHLAIKYTLNSVSHWRINDS